ncbi:hypothetical protein [Arthrobacter sp. StoSoilB20]|uniref:hypothetical protein n=1 Tax=Arthrobacter sp. StoSoilB20 TaxID=2830995 RepID=UPI001CC673D3|nr:hypothetical protein [Arthrobacter sp. StoSoilB20]
MSDLHGGSAAEPPTNPVGPPRYPVVAERHHPQATGQPLPQPGAPRPLTLRELPRERSGSTGLAPFSQLALAFAVLAPTWVSFQFSLMVGYDGLLSFIGLALSGLIIPPLAIVAAVVVGLPLRLIPAVNRWWSGNLRVYASLATITIGLMAAGFVMTVRQVGDLDGIAYDTVTPDPYLLCAGWLLAALLLVNASLPLRWSKKSRAA